MVSDFFTWEILLSFAGCVAATTIVTQFLKNIPFLKTTNNQIISYVIALLIMIVGSIATNTFSISTLGLDLVNAVAVSLTANGAYDGAQAISRKLVAEK